ncbi:MAG: hypothetical protein JXA74_04345 [Anaerolineae bacterium]|nr:hypothetical protein [Anaerolineae bacterium]
MLSRRTGWSLSAAQILGILAFTLALFFMFSFAGKSVEAYRLRNWRDELRRELAQMERERAELVNEIQYRQSAAWQDQALRDSGWLPPDEIRVVPVPGDASSPAPLVDSPDKVVAQPEPWLLFDNPNWRAWIDLLRGQGEGAR